MKTRKTLWGIAFIVVAAIVVLGAVNVFFASAKLLVAALLLIIAVVFAVKRHFVVSTIALAAIATFYKGFLGIAPHSAHFVWIAAILLGIGLSILFGDHSGERWKHRMERHSHRHFSGRVFVDGDGIDAANGFEGKNYSDSVVFSNVVFGDGSSYLNSQSLERVNLKCSFGKMSIYFNESKMSASGAVVNVDCNFGETILYIPREWNVKSNGSALIGEFNAKDIGVHDNGPVLQINGSANFGSVKVIRI